jgi:hypothetical protein
MQTLLGEIYRLLWAGRLKGRKIDGRWYISGASINARLKERKKK